MTTDAMHPDPSNGEIKYRRLFERSHDAIFVVEKSSGHILDANQVAEKLTGYPLATLKTMTTNQLTPIGTEKRLLELKSRNESLRFKNVRYLRKDGSERITDLSVVPLNENTVFAIAADITNHIKTEYALRESETKYQTMMEALLDAVYISSPAYIIVYMNAAMKNRLGADATGSRCYASLHGLSHPCEWCVFNETERNHSVESDIISPLDNKTYRMTSTQFHHNQNHDHHMIVLRDITDYIDAVDEKKKYQTQLLQAQKMESIGNLAGGVAHDFNNMLSIILGYSENLLEQLHSADPLRDGVKEIITAGERSAALTRQLLAFSRRQTLQPVVLNLNKIITNLEKMLGRLIGEDIRLTLVLANDLNHVKVDPGEIEQVIMNLAVNAREAMPKGGELIIETANVVLDELYTDTHPSVIPGDYIMIALSDTGSGIDKQVLSKIFDPFFTTKEKGKGTGLGLSMVYGIVKQSEGNIWVYSEPAHGTTFKIYLPKIDAEKSSSKQITKVCKKTGHGEHILVVEDEMSVRNLVCQMLKKEGYNVHAAANGGEALLLVEEKGLEPDLIIADVVMPGMSGTLLAKRLRKDNPNLKVLHMSGYTDEAIVHHGIIDENTPFIQKPLNIKTLIETVQDIL